MEVLSKNQIMERRKETEQELMRLLAETSSDFSLEHIKEIVYNEDGTDAMTDIIAMFDTGQGAVELENIVEVIQDAWNYFPHKALDELSPAEKVLQHQQRGPNKT